MGQSMSPCVGKTGSWLTGAEGEATEEGMGSLNGRLSRQTQVQFLGEELICNSYFAAENGTRMWQFK